MAKANKFTKLFRDADVAFKGEYGNELSDLHGLSKEDIDSITPDSTDLATYSVLMKVVADASAQNVSQAQLVTNIKALGDVAVKIAKKVPSLASLLA